MYISTHSLQNELKDSQLEFLAPCICGVAAGLLDCLRAFAFLPNSNFDKHIGRFACTRQALCSYDWGSISLWLNRSLDDTNDLPRTLNLLFSGGETNLELAAMVVKDSYWG